MVESAAEMTVKRPEDVSGLLTAWSNGDEEALRDLVSVVYPELRRIARQQLARRSPSHTLESAALANEAYLKLIRARGIQCESRAHFFALCAQMIRRILVDHARNNRYAKRGGDAVRVPLDEGLRFTGPDGVEVLALDQALESLSKIDSPQKPCCGIAILRWPKRRRNGGGSGDLSRNSATRLEDGQDLALS